MARFNHYFQVFPLKRCIEALHHATKEEASSFQWCAQYITSCTFHVSLPYLACKRAVNETSPWTLLNTPFHQLGIAPTSNIPMEIRIQTYRKAILSLGREAFHSIARQMTTCKREPKLGRVNMFKVISDSII